MTAELGLAGAPPLAPGAAALPARFALGQTDAWLAVAR